MFQTTVQSTHLDLFGHVNNARYFEFFEWGRWHWAQAQGVGFLELIQTGVGPVVVHMEANFLKELTLGELITLHTRPISLGNTSFDLAQEMHNEEGDTVATLKVKVVFMDMKRRCSMPIPSSLRMLLEGML